MNAQQAEAFFNANTRQQFEEMLKKEMHTRQREALIERLINTHRVYWYTRMQQEMADAPRQKYSCIVAVDDHGAFSKDGKIPWNYPDDFKWFQTRTKGHICVMGRATYDDIVNHLGSKADVSVLPGRKCFVVTSSPLPKANATAVKSIAEVDKYLTPDDAETKTVFFCGGESIYREGIAKCDEVVITAVNKHVNGDRHFPTTYVQKYFEMAQVFKHANCPDLRFTVWKRKQEKPDETE